MGPNCWTHYITPPIKVVILKYKIPLIIDATKIYMKNLKKSLENKMVTLTIFLNYFC